MLNLCQQISNERALLDEVKIDTPSKHHNRVSILPSFNKPNFIHHAGKQVADLLT
jgi:hypothetical protein